MKLIPTLVRSSRATFVVAFAILSAVLPAPSAIAQTATPTSVSDSSGSGGLNGPSIATVTPVGEIPTVAPTVSGKGTPTPSNDSDNSGTGKPRPSERLCNGGIFKPCTCWTDVPKTVKYNPSDARCGRSTYPGDGENYNASISLGGEFRNAFSVVVRTFENADRSPYESTLCSVEQFRAGLNRCSRWKAQREYRGAATRLVCLGASGYSRVFKNVRRMTVKVSDRKGTNGLKDIRRYCLRNPSMRLN
jgi:hypothetical protein